MEIKTRLAAILVAGVFLATHSGCGGGGGNSDDSSSTSGGKDSVGVVVTDASSEQFSKIELDLTRAELLPVEDEDRVLLLNEPKTIDLLDLRHYSKILAARDLVPAGSYAKVRMYVTKIRLWDENGVRIDKQVKLPSGRIDLHPRGTIDVVDGEIVYVEIDEETDKVIKTHLTGNSQRYIFRPVALIQTITGQQQSKLVRFTGFVESLSTSGQSASFELCSHQPITVDNVISRLEEDVCARVNLDVTTSPFGASANPIATGDVKNGLWLAPI